MSVKADRCQGCERLMRDHGAKREDFPDTVSRATSDTCTSCYARRGGKSTEAVAVDLPCVLVKTLLRPSTYAVFRRKAAELGVGVDVVLSRVADASVRPANSAPPAPVEAERGERVRSGRRRSLSDERIAQMRELRETGTWSFTDLASSFGVGLATAQRYCRGVVIEKT